MKIWIKDNKVLLLDDTDYDYSEMHPGAYIWDGEVPEGTNCQFVIKDGALIYDETIGVAPEPTVEELKSTVEHQEQTIIRQQADIDYLLMLVE